MKINDTKSCILKNKKARFNYEIVEKFESGVVLTGSEIKSIKKNKLQIHDSFIQIEKGEVWLFKCFIESTTDKSVYRKIKLLLHRREINKIFDRVKSKGYTMIPVSVYWKKNFIKMEIALAKGKHLYDKRAALKEKALKRDNKKLTRLTM